MYIHNHTLSGHSTVFEATLFQRVRAGCHDSLNRLMARHDGLVQAVVRRQVLGDLPRFSQRNRRKPYDVQDRALVRRVLGPDELCLVVVRGDDKPPGNCSKSSLVWTVAGMG